MQYLRIALAWLVIASSQVAYASPGDLDDFSNNLASDVAPLLALFGEKITIQYFSESTSFLDYFIFAMAPVGIVTAITAAIRVCGDSSLRAFIGRAQEGDGTIEAELCTSTSRDVCELFHRGGITRVFGKPKILEIVHLTDSNETVKDVNGRYSMGLYIFRDYLRRQEENPSAAWVPKQGWWLLLVEQLFQRHRPKESDEERAGKTKKSHLTDSGRGSVGKGTPRPGGGPDSGTSAQSPNDSDSSESSGPPYELLAQNPNISINIGIVKLPRWYFFIVALIGLLLQGGVIAMAAVISWQLQWTQDGVPESLVDTAAAVSRNRSPMSFIVGTTCLCFGTLACAALIGESTEERRYERRTDPAGEQRSRIFWVQPGNQVVGDETFDAFAYIEDVKEKPLSEYTISSKRKVDRLHPYTWVAVILALGGYIAQFIGLRGMNASVSIAQLAVTLFMSLLRATLRIRRLKRSDNRVGMIPDMIVGHELDWLAFEVTVDDSKATSTEEDGDPQSGRKEGKICGWVLTRQGDLQRRGSEEVDGQTNDAEMALRYRTRLADLTGHGTVSTLESQGSKPWSDNQVIVRVMAQKLAAAIGGAADTMLGVGNGQMAVACEFPVLLWRWKTRQSSGPNKITRIWNKVADTRLDPIEVVLQPPDDKSPGQWTTDSARLEGILGLYLWSLKQSESFQKRDQTQDGPLRPGGTPKARILYFSKDGGDTEAMENELNLWLGQDKVKLARSTLDHQSEKWPFNSSIVWKSGDGKKWKPKKPRFLDRGEDRVELFNSETAVQPSARTQNKQFFGWQFMSSVETEDSSNETHILYTASTNGLLNQCCQDVYSILLASILSKSGCRFEDVTVSETPDQLQLQEPRISSMVAQFTKSDLGSRSDAILCIVPCLQKRITPRKSLEPSLIQVLDQKNDYKDKADALLEWTYFHSQVADGDTTAARDGEAFGRGLITVCEFFRRLLEADQTQEARQLGYLKLQGVVRKYQPKADQVDKELEEIVERYGTIAKQISIDHREINHLQGLAYNGLTRVPKHSDLLAVIAAGNRTETLYLLCVIPSRRLKTEFEVALPLAARNGWDEVARAFLDVEVSIDVQTEEGRTTLSYYCGRQLSYSMVETLLSRGAHPDLPDNNSRTPLWWAAQTGDRQVVKALCDTGKVIIDSADHQGRSPVSAAAEKGHRDVLRLLSTTGLARLDRADQTRRTPFSYAASNGHKDIIHDMIKDSRVDPDSRDSIGRTPLSWAAGNGHLGVVETLIRFPYVDQQSIDEEGKTPLLWAVENGHLDVVGELCKYNGPLKSDIQGLGPLARASRAGSLGMVKRVLSYVRPSRESPDDMGRTALWWAFREGHLEIAKLLHNLDASSTDTRDRAGRTPLWWAARNGQDEIVKFLLNNGADPATPDSNGETPLLWAVRNGHKTIVQLLLDTERVDSDARGSFGRTVLMWAARRGALDLVEVLLKFGKVDLALQDDDGRTALSWALKAGNPSLVVALGGSNAIKSVEAWTGKINCKG